ncbi:hypothetical protein LXA47_27360 [Massilia sp. P8910]|uniref:hypothetical protein n=1 Tax=Massilia antarctica TaxID=2765360 RepID=UPI001E447C35|nr:hypothetical protein [Massilia antarctica]MCE3607288.1 hypothetical protein [Massilia antarctica]
MLINRQQFPILFAWVPYDGVDANEVPLLEGGTNQYPDYRSSIDYRTSHYPGQRQQCGRPMNVGALRALDVAGWKCLLANFNAIAQLAGRDPMGRLLCLSHTCLSLPYMTKEAAGPRIPAAIANAFKVFRGVALYAEHRLAYSVGNAGDDLSMYAYTERHGLFVGAHESCPAPQAMVDAIEADIFRFLDQAPGADAHAIGLPQETLERALNVGMLNILYHVATACFSAIYLSRMPQWEVELLPRIPFTLAAIDKSRAGQGSEFVAGLTRLFHCAEVGRAIWQRLLHRFIALTTTPDLPSLTSTYIEIVALINADLVALLGPDTTRLAPSLADMTAVVTQLMRIR